MVNAKEKGAEKNEDQFLSLKLMEAATGTALDTK